jgi:PAS domain S-box-containing protein
MNALMPHGFCLLWQPELLALHVGADALIAASYFAIPLAMLVLLRKRNDFAYRSLYVLFAGFVLSCGVTHLLGIWTLWHPDYWLQGMVKALSAGISVLTAVMCWRLLPKMVAMPTQAQLQQANSALQQQVQQNEDLLAHLQQKQQTLEASLAELATTKQQLQTQLAISSTTLDHTSGLIGLLSLDGVLLEANRGALAFIGVSKQQVVGQYFWQTPWWQHSPDLQQQLQTAIRDVATKIHASVAFTATHPDANGQLHRIAFRLSAVYDDQGAVIYLVPTGGDITAQAERDSLQGQLLQSQRMEVFGTLTAGIAHDFNNILAAIMGYTELSQELLNPATADAELVSHLNQVAIAGKRAKVLIQKLMAYCRREASDQYGNAIDLLPLVDEALDMLAPTMSAGIAFNVTRSQVPLVMIDPVDFNQIITNLVVNARDAMGEHGALSVHMGTAAVGDNAVCSSCHQHWHADDEAAWVVVSVSDSGCGIEPAVLASIFEPFFTTKPVGKGTGLGLSVICGIVHRAGGHVLCQSQLGQGTTFRIVLPASREAPSSEAPLAAVASAKTARLRLLLVEDEALLLQLMTARLSALGHQVAAFSRPLLALEAFAADPDGFDAVISDFSMPIMDGEMLSQRLLALRPAMPIVLYSGQDQSGRAIGDSVQYLMKPVETELLVQALDRVANAGTANA